jgi:DNA polymerase III subunit alpha
MDTLPPDFTHLRVHSHFSLLDGTAAVPDLARRAAADGLRALALTDHNALYGAAAFERACRAAALQPLLGMTLALAASAEDLPDSPGAPGQVLLIADGPIGYRSLCRLSACLQAHADREARLRRGAAWDDLRAHSAGLICIDAGLAGWLARCVLAGRTQAARRFAGRLGAIFPDRCYVGLELQQPGDTAVAQELIRIGARFGMPPVAAQPIFALTPEDAALRPLLAAIDQNRRLAPAAAAPPDAGVWPDPAALAARFASFPEALANVGRIVQQCRAALPDGRPIWPALDLPDDLSPDDALVEAAFAGLEALPAAAAEAQMARYTARLEQELAAIERHDFAPLLLLVADVVRFARAQEIPVNTRGSVANSLVAYCLGISNVDPLAHDLLFERFLNPARASLPDIDLDFCSRRRDEALAYVRARYGAERVALVGTMSTLQPRSALRAAAKAYGLAETRSKALADLLPHRWHPDPQRREGLDAEALLAQVADPAEKEVLAQALRLIGRPDHLSLHPGGIVVTPGPLTDAVPVQMAPKGFLATQLGYDDLEELGLPKIDLLGIRALTVLADTAVAVRAHHDPAFRLANIPLDDPQTADLLSQGATVGVFQCESEGAQRTLRQLRARGVRDLAVSNAFFKPGPATGGMAQAFVRRYRGEEPVSFLHPALAPILGATQGVLLFQEQILRVAREVAGLSWAQADVLRRGMSKFKGREMGALRLSFLRGCQEKSGLTPEQAATLWEQVLAFAGYGFNQGHATAYADVSYRSAYLKAHYPAEFLCARLADRGGFHHPAVYVAEARRLGMAVQPPHVNVSGRKFTLTRGVAHAAPDEAATLWMGLGEVRSLRRAAVRAIVAGRAQRPFHSLRDLLTRVPLQPRETRHLIQCGALDGLGAPSRAALLAEAAQIGRAGSARQLAFDFAAGTAVAPETAAERFAWELRVLGLPVSVNPLHLVAGLELHPTTPLRDLPRQPGRRVILYAYRLPGWPGGAGFFVSDGDTFVVAKTARGLGGKRPLWRPLRLVGAWQADAWGGGWFQAEEIELLPTM